MRRTCTYYLPGFYFPPPLHISFSLLPISSLLTSSHPHILPSSHPPILTIWTEASCLLSANSTNFSLVIRSSISILESLLLTLLNSLNQITASNQFRSQLSISPWHTSIPPLSQSTTQQLSCTRFTAIPSLISSEHRHPKSYHPITTSGLAAYFPIHFIKSL